MRNITLHKLHVFSGGLLIAFFVFFLLLLLGESVYAEGFVPLSREGDLPAGVNPQGGNLMALINGLFVVALGAGALLAVVMIAIGGIQYMGTDSYSSKESAKTRIREAIIGLVILLGSFLFLRTINPDLVNLDIFQPARDAAVVPAQTQPIQGGGFGQGASRPPGTPGNPLPPPPTPTQPGGGAGAALPPPPPPPPPPVTTFQCFGDGCCGGQPSTRIADVPGDPRPRYQCQANLDGFN